MDSRADSSGAAGSQPAVNMQSIEDTLKKYQLSNGHGMTRGFILGLFVASAFALILWWVPWKNSSWMFDGSNH